jgi:hypothetical protein
VASRLTARKAVELTWIATWVALAAWLGYPHEWWGRACDAFVAAWLALFRVVRLRDISPPDNWFGGGDLFAAFAPLVIAPGALGQLVRGKPWIAGWSLGPPSILLAFALAGVTVRDVKLHREARQSRAAVAHPWSSEPHRGPKQST